MRKTIFRHGFKKITVNLPMDLYEWLKKEADRRGIEIARVIRDCIRHVMEESRDEAKQDND
jgi:metal-responsive CopG/Arc/MetJ family transcriptional regulator